MPKELTQEDLEGLVRVQRLCDRLSLNMSLLYTAKTDKWSLTVYGLNMGECFFTTDCEALKDCMNSVRSQVLAYLMRFQQNTEEIAGL